MSAKDPSQLTGSELDLWGIAAATARYDTAKRKRLPWGEVARELKLVETFGSGAADDDEDRSRLARRWFERAERRGMFELSITPTPHGELDLDAAAELEKAVRNVKPAAPTVPEVIAVEVPPLPADFDLGISESELTLKAVAFHGRRSVTRYIREIWDPETGVEIAVGSGRKVGILVRSIQDLKDDPHLDALKMAVASGSEIRLRSLGGGLAVSGGMGRDGGSYDADFNTRAMAAALVTQGGSDKRRRELESRTTLVEYPLIARKAKMRDIENLKAVFEPPNKGLLGDIAILGLGLLNNDHHFNEAHWRLDAIRPLIDSINAITKEVETPVVAHIGNRYWTIDRKFLPSSVKQSHIDDAHDHCTTLNGHIRAAALRDIANVPHRIVVSVSSETTPGKDKALASLLATDMNTNREDKILPPTMLITDSRTAKRVTKLVHK